VRKHGIGSIVMEAAAAAVLLSLAPEPTAGQSLEPVGSGLDLLAEQARAKLPTGPAPRLPDGKPDFSGVWGADGHFLRDITEALKKGEELPMQPWALKTAKERMSKDDPEANCLPTGVPRLAPFPWSIVQTPKSLLSKTACELSAPVARFKQRPSYY
jgi:hypothetical protein